MPIREQDWRNLHLPSILRTCFGVFALLVALLFAALLAGKQAARRT